MKKPGILSSYSVAFLIAVMGIWIGTGSGCGKEKTSLTAGGYVSGSDSAVVQDTVESSTSDVASTVQSLRDVDADSGSMMAESMDDDAMAAMTCPSVTKQVSIIDASGNQVMQSAPAKCTQAVGMVDIKREWSTGCRLGKGTTMNGSIEDIDYSRPSTFHVSMFDTTESDLRGNQWKQKGTRSVTPTYGPDHVLASRAVASSYSRSKANTKGMIYDQDVTTSMNMAFVGCVKGKDYCANVTSAAGATFDCKGSTVTTNGTVTIHHKLAKARSVATIAGVVIGPSTGCCYPTAGSINVKIYKDSTPDTLEKEGNITFTSSCGLVTVDGRQVDFPECQ